MRGKGYSIGEKAGILDIKHVEAMGPARWLFSWAIRRQTGQKEGFGVVLYGRPITYEMIKRDLGVPSRTIRRWMDRLTLQGYLKTRRHREGLIIFVAKEKKFKGNSYPDLTTELPPKEDVENSVNEAVSSNLRLSNNGLSRVANNGLSRVATQSGPSETEVSINQLDESKSGHSEQEIQSGHNWPLSNGQSDSQDTSNHVDTDASGHSKQYTALEVKYKDRRKVTLSPSSVSIEKQKATAKNEEKNFKSELSAVLPEHSIVDDPDDKYSERRKFLREQAKQLLKNKEPTEPYEPSGGS